MAAAKQREDELVEVRMMLPRYARDELDRRAALDGMRRSTLIRVLVLRDLRRQPEPSS